MSGINIRRQPFIACRWAKRLAACEVRPNLITSPALIFANIGVIDGPAKAHSDQSLPSGWHSSRPRRKQMPRTSPWPVARLPKFPCLSEPIFLLEDVRKIGTSIARPRSGWDGRPVSMIRKIGTSGDYRGLLIYRIKARASPTDNGERIRSTSIAV
jgi:hypothetical protein